MRLVRYRIPAQGCGTDVQRQDESGICFHLLKGGFSLKVRPMNYADIITMEPGKRGGKPCIRGLRITVYDVLEYLASGMTHEDILRDFPYLTEQDIRACLAFAADRERKSEMLNA
jgi:uncharacterized protein (DUF433 family)